MKESVILTSNSLYEDFKKICEYCDLTLENNNKINIALNPNFFSTNITNIDINNCNFWIDGIGFYLPYIILGKKGNRIRGLEIYEGKVNNQDNNLKYLHLIPYNNQKITEFINHLNGENIIFELPNFNENNIKEYVEENYKKFLEIYNIIYIYISTPKQEILAQEIYKINKTSIYCVGAALEFKVGIKKNHKILGRLNLEWFGRLISEPKRNLKRVKVSGLITLKLVIYSIKTRIFKN